MKLIKSKANTFTFLLSAREKTLLLEVLRHYPLLPSTYHRAHHDHQAELTESQQWLEEALAETKEHSREQLQEWLKRKEVFKATDEGFELVLTVSRSEWLLQILNDVRLGSWVQLGSPQPGAPPSLQADPQNLRLQVLLELSGKFQMALLHALDKGASDDTDADE